MGAGKGQQRRARSSAPEAAPEVLAGDWIEITASSSALFPWMPPLDGVLAEVEKVWGSEEIWVIANGRLGTGLYWANGDRWKKTLPPTDLPAGAVRSSAAPSSGLPTAHSWRDRGPVTHPLVAGKDGHYGWFYLKGAEDLVAVAGKVCDVLYETGDVEDWRDPDFGDDIDEDALDPVAVRKAVELGQLLSEADCMNDGFILHHNGKNFELEIRGAEDLKGLEQIVEAYEDLGATVLEGELSDEQIEAFRAWENKQL